MAVDQQASILSQTIQLALAPAFLLVATGSLLNVMTGRLARVVDRVRTLEKLFVDTEGEDRERVVWELRRLDKRMTLVNNAIGLCVGCSILTCLMVAGLFMVEIGSVALGTTISWLFILAMAVLSISLILFLVEVRFAGQTIHVREEFMIYNRK